MTEQDSMTESLIAHAKSQKYYIDHLPVRELMNRSKHTINPFDTLDDYKFLMMSKDASVVAICGGVAYDTTD